MKKFLALSMLTALVLVGCNKAAAPTTTTPATDGTTTTTTPAPKAEDGIVADAPKECPNKSSVVVKSEETGTVNVAAANSWYVEQTPDSGTFYFTNYTFDPQSAWGHTYTDTDAMAYFSVGTTDKKAVANGSWDAAKKDTHKLSDTNISSKKASRGLIGDKKKVEITYFGSDYVCGDVAIDDGYGSITGKFIAKYHKWTSSL
ncbi:MAG: hypothetical protein NTZ25_01915 [Candidatus Peregrinibacteria bacterium]|nr:hypothetical protein [Candidatus Peregrinibacteria bacterium]